MTLRHILATSAVATVALCAVPALAQDDPAMGRGASTIACGDIAEMSSEDAAPVLYYLSGYTEGQLSGMAGAQGVEGEGAATAVVTSDAGSEAAAGIEADQAASGKETDIEGLQQAGFDEIAVDEVLTACKESPDMPVMDVMKGM